MRKEFYKEYERVSVTKARTAFKKNKTVIYWNESQLINETTKPNYVTDTTIFDTPKLKYFIVVD